MKAKEFIKNIKGKPKIRYCPVSPSNYIINLAIKNIKERLAELADPNFKELDFFDAILEKMKNLHY